jgi:hypothetical protein
MNRKLPRHAQVMAVIGLVHIALVIATWRDLRNRMDTQIRGTKRLWRVWSAANTLGSVAYWLVGRRRGTSGFA